MNTVSPGLHAAEGARDGSDFADVEHQVVAVPGGDGDRRFADSQQGDLDELAGLVLERYVQDEAEVLLGLAQVLQHLYGLWQVNVSVCHCATIRFTMLTQSMRVGQLEMQRPQPTHIVTP